MDTIIRNLDPKAYRALEARALLLGKNVGDALNEAIRDWLARTESQTKSGSLRDLRPVALPKGSERLSDEIDDVVYGASR